MDGQAYVIVLLICCLCEDSNISQKAKVSMCPVVEHSYCCVREGNDRACRTAQNGFKNEVKFSVPFPESDCGSNHVPQIHSSRCACLHTYFFVYTSLCVCGALLLYRRVTRDSGTLEGGEGLTGRGRTSLITAGLRTLTWHETEHANSTERHEYPNKDSNATRVASCIVMQCCLQSHCYFTYVVGLCVHLLLIRMWS